MTREDEEDLNESQMLLLSQEESPTRVTFPVNGSFTGLLHDKLNSISCLLPLANLRHKIPTLITTRNLRRMTSFYFLQSNFLH